MLRQWTNRKTRAPREITLPFLPRFKEPMCSTPQRKIYTCRTSAKGRAGDTFKRFGHTFVLEEVRAIVLRELAPLWREEGCKSEQELKDVWSMLHPSTGWKHDRPVVLHKFKRLT